MYVYIYIYIYIYISIYIAHNYVTSYILEQALIEEVIRSRSYYSKMPPLKYAACISTVRADQAADADELHVNKADRLKGVDPSKPFLLFNIAGERREMPSAVERFNGRPVVNDPFMQRPPPAIFRCAVV